MTASYCIDLDAKSYINCKVTLEFRDLDIVVKICQVCQIFYQMDLPQWDFYQKLSVVSWLYSHFDTMYCFPNHFISTTVIFYVGGFTDFTGTTPVLKSESPMKGLWKTRLCVAKKITLFLTGFILLFQSSYNFIMEIKFSNSHVFVEFVAH